MCWRFVSQELRQSTVGMTHGCSVISGSSAGEDRMAVDDFGASTRAICLGLFSSPWASAGVQSPRGHLYSFVWNPAWDGGENWGLAGTVLSAGCMVDGLHTGQLASLKLRIPREHSKRPRPRCHNFLWFSLTSPRMSFPYIQLIKHV